MSEDADDNQKAIRKYYEDCMRNIQMNSQSAMILPNAIDPETKQPLFKLDLLSLDGKKGFDITKIKEYYKNLILTSLFADVLVMGQTATGSFALGSIKNSLSGGYAKSMIQSIVDVLNNELILQTYVMNGWNPARAGRLDVDSVDDTDLETLSKAFQRLGATGFLPKTADVINRGLEALGVDRLDPNISQEELDSMLSEKTTRSGDGMQEGLNSGTGSATGAAGNSSDLNSDNTA